MSAVSSVSAAPTPSHSAPAASLAAPLRFGHALDDGGDGWRIEWRLKRNCSLAPGQLFGFYLGLCTMSLGIGTMFWWQGARMVMPFAWVELAVVGASMLVYARHAADHESIALRPGRLVVASTSGNRLTQVEFQPEWVKVEPLNADRSLIELSGQGRRIAIGRFVRPELRGALARELRRAVRLVEAHGAPLASPAQRRT